MEPLKWLIFDRRIHSLVSYSTNNFPKDMPTMQLLVISGSHQRNSQSSKVARHLAQRSVELQLFASSEVLDLSASTIPFWDEGAFDPKHEQWKTQLSELNDQLRAAAAYILVSPEWHGTVPSRLKNLMLFFSSATVGHKPALIAAVSGSRGGAYPVVELRATAYKNSRLCFIPEHLIVRNVGEVMNDGEPQGEEDGYIRDRGDFALRGLAEYARAMATMDRSILISKEYANGM
ncbi:MAG: NAD(P)H-dependent oxidoreductase [Pseudomonadota bacterium]